MKAFLIKWLSPIIITLVSTLLQQEVANAKKSLADNKTLGPAERDALNQMLDQLPAAVINELTVKLNNKDV